MNKFFTKVAAFSACLAMAIGVGVAVGSGNNDKEPNQVSAALNNTPVWSSGTPSFGSSYAGGVTKTLNGVSWFCSNVGNNTSMGWNKSSQNHNDASSAPLSSISQTTKIGLYQSSGGWNVGKIVVTVANADSVTGTWYIWYSTNSGSSWTQATTGTLSASTTSFTYDHGSNLGAGTRFAFGYGTTKTTGTRITLSNIQVYEYQSVTLESITLGGSYQTAFTVGDTFNHSGMTVTAHYSDSSTATVTSSASWSTPDMSSAGNKTVTVSYTEGGVNKTANYNITVAAPSTPTLSLDKASFSGYTGQSFSVTATFANLESDLAWSASGTGSISGGSITWSSADHRNGTSTYSATLSGEGTKTIVADADGVDAEQCVVTITQTTVDITKASTSIAQGKNETLAASHNASSVDGLTWTSDNAKVTVDNNGKVTVANDATVGSTATITATSKVDTSVSDTCTVTVTEAPLEYEVVFGTAEGTSGISDFSNTSYIIPSGVTLDNIQGNVYSNISDQAASLRLGKSGTTGSFDATISGNYYITSVKCNLKYYGSDSTATFAVTPDGGSAISKSLTSDWADYTYDVSAAKAKTVTLGTDVNGKRAFLSGFTITYAAKKVLSNIALSGTYPTTFTKGDTFSHSGMVVTANYSDSTSATVTGSATWSSPDMSTPGNKTVTVSYSDEYGSASQTYSITVSYANPTSITLSLNSKKLVLLEEFDVADVEVTINPSATADQSLYEWVVYDSDGLVEGDTYEFNNGVFYASEPADAVVLRCQSTKEGYAATVYADVTVEITGDPIVTLFNASDADKTNGTDSAFTDADDITYHVTAENFSGTITYTWSTSDDSIISIDSDNGSSCDFYVEGDEGSARLSCRVQDTASHDVTVYVDVTINAWSVTSVTWTAPTINVYSGASLSSTSGWNVKYSTDSGKTDQTPDSFKVMLGGSEISLPHEWSAADDGKALGVQFGGVNSSTTNVKVTQTLRAVNAPVPGDEKTSTLTFTAACGGSGTSDDGEEWAVTSDGTESTYDPTKGIHYGTNGAAVQYINLTTSDFTSGKITKVVVNASTASGVTATVAVNVGGSAFGGAAQSLSQTAAEYTFEGNVDADEIEVIVTKPSSATKAIYCKSIAVTYAEESGETTNIANVAGHEDAQRAVVKFAKAFNAALGETENCTTGLDDAWSTASSAWNTFLSEAAALGETEEAYALNLVKYATAQWTKNTDSDFSYCLERALATYEKCVSAHGQTEFMSDVRPVGANVRVSPLGDLSKNSSTIIIVVVTSLVAVAAIGGYFLLRKRKED